MTRTPDDWERDAVEDAGYPWDEDDYDDPLDGTRGDDEPDEPPEDYTWPGEGMGGDDEDDR